MDKKIRLLTAIAVTLTLGGMAAYQDVKENGAGYQSHPVVSIATDFFGGFLGALIFYFGSGWLAKRKEKSVSNTDAQFYDQIAKELKDNTLIPGLWTKVYAEMNGDEGKARALYIRYRVKELSDKQTAAVNQQAQQAKESRAFCQKYKKYAEYAAMPPLSTPMKAVNLLVSILFGLLCLLFGLGGLTALIEAISNHDIEGAVGVFLVCVLLTFLFGLASMKCFKHAAR